MHDHEYQCEYCRKIYEVPTTEQQKQFEFYSTRFCSHICKEEYYWEESMKEE